jgi:nucleoid DNA-binding protein
MTTSGRAAKTSIAQGTKKDFKVRSTATVAFCSGAALKALLGLNAMVN